MYTLGDVCTSKNAKHLETGGAITKEQAFHGLTPLTIYSKKNQSITKMLKKIFAFATRYTIYTSFVLVISHSLSLTYVLSRSPYLVIQCNLLLVPARRSVVVFWELGATHAVILDQWMGPKPYTVPRIYIKATQWVCHRSDISGYLSSLRILL